MPENDKDFDWFKWAGIKPRKYEELVVEAKKYDVPVFETDKEVDIYNRILSFKSYNNNQDTLKTNKILTGIAFISALVSIITIFLK